MWIENTSCSRSEIKTKIDFLVISSFWIMILHNTYCNTYEGYVLWEYRDCPRIIQVSLSTSGPLVDLHCTTCPSTRLLWYPLSCGRSVPAPNLGISSPCTMTSDHIQYSRLRATLLRSCDSLMDNERCISIQRLFLSYRFRLFSAVGLLAWSVQSVHNKYCRLNLHFAVLYRRIVDFM